MGVEGRGREVRKVERKEQMKRAGEMGIFPTPNGSSNPRSFSSFLYPPRRGHGRGGHGGRGRAAHGAADDKKATLVYPLS